MELKLKRGKSHSDHNGFTIGELILNGKTIMYTMEDEHRDVKVDGETRIPAGKYKIELQTESRFKEKYIKLLTQFELNLNYYETVYDEKISNHSEYQINEFNSYFFSINSTLSRIVKKHTDQYESSVLFYLQHAQKRRISFKENTVNKISEKLSPFIILK